MSANTDSPLIMMVAQAPFETDLNKFCKLIPVAYADGTSADPLDFPNDGEIWWMLTAYTSGLAEPGQLLVGSLELAARYVSNDPVSSRYQVVRESVQPLNLGAGLEILNIPGDRINNIEDVVAPGFCLDLEVHPTATVLLHWRSNFYGPFKAACVTSANQAGASRYWFVPANSDGVTIYEIDEKSFAGTTRNHRLIVEDTVSLTDHRRCDSYDTRNVRHDLLLPAGYERLLANDPHRIAVESLERTLQRFARNCLTRGKRQQLKTLLEELEITGREGDNAQDLVQAVARAKATTASQDASLDAVAQALLKSGLLGEDRIAKAEQAYGAKYVEESTAELQAAVEQSLTTARAELRQVEEELKREKANLLKQKSEQRTQLARELAAERQTALHQLSAEKEELAKQKAELERQQHLLRESLQKVTKEFREAGDEVVNRFLTIAPLLSAVNLVNRQPLADQSTSTSAPAGPKPPTPDFVLPAYISAPQVPDGGVTEDAFFERFRKLVENSGFTFRQLDLQRFHLSVKCGDLTVLGGPSGTGKSSLPALYAQALLGEEGARQRPGCLMVNVNPSWMDTRDLLGHMNTLDGRFYPAESGLFQHLVCAQREYETRASATGIYLACLDEMNLSQVEHYFSDFMMVLERTGGDRKVKCFSPETATDSCPFRKWGEVVLSPALRFVGTVNFDETTRLLSDRLLDRVNLIRLTSAGLPGPAAAKTALPSASGRLVTLADLDAWCSANALPADLGTLLDQMRPILAQMGCPISPRVYRGICRFVASSAHIMSQEKAFEVQVAQRIAPRVRSLITNRQIEGLDALLKLLNQSSPCAFEESLSLLEQARDSISGRQWELES